MTDERENRIHQTYRDHPLSAATILRRLSSRYGESLPPLSEFDLAVDLTSGVTDQNHVGGAEAVLDVARDLCPGNDASILDVGSGIGGPARLLASLRPCRVLGVELTETRYRDSLTLTQLVGLERQVHFQEGDILSVDLPAGSFDGAMLFDCFNHFSDKAVVLRHCLRACRSGARIVIQDTGMARGPLPDELPALQDLTACWNVNLLPPTDWLAAVEGLVRVEQRLTLNVEFIAHFARLLAQQRHWSPGMASTDEVRAWRLAVQLQRAGLLAYSRIVLSKL